MEHHTIQQLQQKAGNIFRIRKEMRPKRLSLYCWSIVGNVCSLLATATAVRSSDILSSVLYLSKYAVLLFRLQPLEKEIRASENEIDQTLNEATDIAELNKPLHAGSLNIRSSLRCSIRVLFVLELVQRCYLRKPVDVTENTNRLFRSIYAVGKAIEQKKLEIEHLPPMLQNMKAVIEDMGNKTLAVVEQIPNVNIPANKEDFKSLLDKEIIIEQTSAIRNPECHKKYFELSSKIETVRKYKRDFEQHALGIVKTARKCLQASEAATTLPTYQLIKDPSKNVNFLNEAQKSLKAAEVSENEFKQLQLNIKDNQHYVTQHVTKILHATSEAYDNVSQFDIDIKSKLKNPTVIETAKKIQRQAEKHGHVKKSVDDVLSAITKANLAINDVEQSSRPSIKGIRIGSPEIEVNKIPYVKDPEDWAYKVESLETSVKELAKHAQCIVKTPEKIVDRSFKNSKPTLVAQTTEIAKEALEISDEVLRVLEQENGDRNPPGQLRVLQRVFSRVWSTCKETTNLPETTMKMRSEAQNLRLKIKEPEKSTGQEWFYRLSYLIHISTITFDLYKLYTLGNPHPKETWLLAEIERVKRNNEVSGRRNQN